MEDNFRIGIVGGKGKMGSFFAKFFREKGYEVLIKDVDLGPSYEELCKTSKVILLSVPLDRFPQVVSELSPYVREENWVFDICSLKLDPVRIMRRYLKKGEVLATHPLFGPYEKSLKDRIIAYYPVRGKGIKAWFIELFSSAGAKLVYVPPREHDRMMGLIQVMNHFFLVLFGNILAGSKLDLKRIVDLSTPSFEGILQVLRRLAWQDENLYARIQLDNPFGRQFRRLFLRECKRLIKALDYSEDPERIFKEKFIKAKLIAKELDRLLPRKD
ncbi:MAG: prephenate dehydrogenase/arogenate dehydrogenase family protein [Caldimicrobium sp.]|nr:prephenate dehydrogenase/arogenate dehydrogenase family protein [Caldimicrobium sp.]